jgi:hypothetical protein
LIEAGCDKETSISEKTKAVYFRAEDWTEVIGLKALAK